MSAHYVYVAVELERGLRPAYAPEVADIVAATRCKDLGLRAVFTATANTASQRVLHQLLHAVIFSWRLQFGINDRVRVPIWLGCTVRGR